jgi:hypothetical protein
MIKHRYKLGHRVVTRVSVIDLIYAVGTMVWGAYFAKTCHMAMGVLGIALSGHYTRQVFRLRAEKRAEDV